MRSSSYNSTQFSRFRINRSLAWPVHASLSHPSSSKNNSYRLLCRLGYHQLETSSLRVSLGAAITATDEPLPDLDPPRHMDVERFHLGHPIVRQVHAQKLREINREQRLDPLTWENVILSCASRGIALPRLPQGSRSHITK